MNQQLDQSQEFTKTNQAAFDGLVEEFNDFFRGDAEATCNSDNLHLTIGGRTVVFRMPALVGFQSRGPSPQT